MNPSQKADQGRQEELEDIIELIRRGARVDEGNNVPIVLENNYTRIQAKTDLNRLITSEAERIAKLVIGEDVPIFVNGVQVKHGEPMKIDLSGGVEDAKFRESCKNIQENGRNLEKAAMRKRLAELVKGEADNV